MFVSLYNGPGLESDSNFPFITMLGVLSILYQNVDWKALAIALPVTLILLHVIPYLLDPHKIRKYPGPFFAKFSDIWLGWVSKSGHRSEVVHQIHQKYGTPR
jgi:benzoate 4-monooxygenase